MPRAARWASTPSTSRSGRARANAATVYYNLACGLALAGKRDDALATLETAVERGWSDANHMLADTDLTSLRSSPRFTALVAKLRAAKP
jgi:A/B hydrolase-like, N-terminal domain